MADTRRVGRKDEEQLQRDQKGMLDLSGMSLEIFPSLTLNLALVTTVDLSNNNLQSIPESLVARLLNLVVLDVHSNQLKSLPNSIGCLSKLKVLNVSGNLIQSLPKTIEDCRSLEELNANFNKLTKLPDTLGFELHNLRKLAVNSNKLALLPYSTSHMTALRVLDARLNCLRALPDGLENLVRLEVLNVSQNFQFLDTLPYAIGLLGSLRELDVSYNNLRSLPDSIGCLTQMTKFSAEGNPLVSPPMEVVQQSIPALREYLAARMNGAGDPAKKKKWFPKMVRYRTFTAGMLSPAAGVNASRIRDADGDELMMSEYRRINGLASPRFLNLGMFSPSRLFSPKRASSSPRK